MEGVATAVRVAWLALFIVNICALEVPPPGVPVNTVTVEVPVVEMFPAGTVAVSCAEEIKVVVSGEPFQLITEPETNDEPFAVKVNPLPPTVVEVGEIELNVGTGLLTVIVGCTEIFVKVPASEILAVVVAV